MLPKEKTKKKTEFRRQNTFLYGLPKCGKSTFASQIPGALFLATEEGLNQLEVFKVPITKWEDVYTLGKDLTNTKHEFTTLVVDIADWFYKHCEHYICKKFDVFHPSDLAYGKGFSLVKDEFVRVVNGLNQLGLGLIFISHAKEKTIEKTSMKYTVMDASLSGAAGLVVCGLCDYIFYAYIDEKGQRLMRTKPNKYVNAGDRSGKLPELIEFDYAKFALEYDKALGLKKEEPKKIETPKPINQGEKK